MPAHPIPATPSPPPARSGPAGAADPARRQRELMRLLPLWPHEIADESAAGRARVAALLRRALRAERRRGLAGHWSYDLGRHAQLLAAYRAERVACAHTDRPGRE